MTYRKWMGMVGVAMITLLGMANAWADDAEQCENFIQADKYTQAFPACRKAAEQGVADAQYSLGVMYDNGMGVRTSGAAAADWYYKAGLSYLEKNDWEGALRCCQ